MTLTNQLLVGFVLLPWFYHMAFGFVLGASVVMVVMSFRKL